ncbi:MAG: prenyltransferase [Planctomycetes bacterium]|jgi:1,4-dihydroxy-2-naphthoate octaprenyltransferase|nr:prenyltransferase [Planctomycetota bacterium]
MTAPSLRALFAETRPHFLLLSVTLVLVGSAAAAADGPLSWPLFALTLAGLLLLHVGCNVLNDWFDWRSGIDARTVRTPFSGGSGYLPGIVSPRAALALGLGATAAGSAAGLVLAWATGWALLAVGAAGVFIVLTYNAALSKVMLGELSAGLGLGFLPVIGTYLVQRGTVSAGVALLAVPAGLLTLNLLFLNEFPDAEADRAGGRRHLVIVLGSKWAGRLYAFLNAAIFAWIAAGAAAGWFSPWALLSLLALPLAARGALGALRDHGDRARLVPAQGANVGMVLGTQALLAAGVFLSTLL